MYGMLRTGNKSGFSLTRKKVHTYICTVSIVSRDMAGYTELGLHYFAHQKSSGSTS